jgi:hypothetical protein
MAARARVTTIRERGQGASHGKRKEHPMKHFRILVPLAAALALAVVAAGTALAAQTAAFTGTFAGKVTEQVDGQSVKASATGTGSPVLGNVRLGKSTLTGLVAATTANPPCSPLSGPGTITSKLGKMKVTLATTSRGCAASEEDQNSITVSGDAKVNGGTLKFKKAKGSLHFSGKYDRKAGTFLVKLTGRLTY